MNSFTKLFISLILFVIVCAGLTNEATASHFRYGHLSYVKNPLNNNEVEFTLTNAFRRSGYGAPVVGSIITETVGGTALLFGDATSTPTLRYRVISIDVANDFLVGRALQPGDDSKESITKLYAAGGPYMAEINSCCRTTVEINNPNQSYRVSTLVDVTTGNNSPVITLPVIVNLVQGPASSFAVPAIDADPDTFLRWRPATLVEMGSVLQNPPSAGGFTLSVDPLTGVCTWNTTAAAIGGLYSCQIIVEDRNSNDSTLRTRVAVDFLIRISPPCPNPNVPVFDGPTPACGSAIAASVGNNITFTVQASDADPGNVSLNAVGLPIGATMNPVLPTSGNPVSSIFSWTPASNSPQIVTFIATDSCGAQTLCTFSFDFALPVELAAFTSIVNNNDVTLNWSTLTETNNSGFDIERSNVEGQWSKVGNVTGNGNATTMNTYTFTDRNLASGQYNYRLKQVDFNGNFEYFNLSNEVNIGTPNTFSLMQNYPNPFNPSTKIEFGLPTDGNVQLTVYDNSGKLVATIANGFRTAGFHSVDFSADNLASGIYFYKLEYNNGGQSSLIKVMKMSFIK